MRTLPWVLFAFGLIVPGLVYEPGVALLSSGLSLTEAAATIRETLTSRNGWLTMFSAALPFVVAALLVRLDWEKAARGTAPEQFVSLIRDIAGVAIMTLLVLLNEGHVWRQVYSLQPGFSTAVMGLSQTSHLAQAGLIAGLLAGEFVARVIVKRRSSPAAS